MFMVMGFLHLTTWIILIMFGGMFRLIRFWRFWRWVGRAPGDNVFERLVWFTCSGVDNDFETAHWFPGLGIVNFGYVITDRSSTGEQFVTQITEISSISVLAFILGGMNRRFWRAVGIMFRFGGMPWARFGS